MMTRICASVTAQTMDKLMDALEKGCREGADLIEVRMDFLKEHPDIKRIVENSTKPLIATNRSQIQGGRFKGCERARLKTLFTAAQEGFEYVDLDMATPRIRDLTLRFEEETDVKLIISHHNFQSTPGQAQLNSILREEERLGAQVCKIVPTANTFEDNLTCLNFTAQASKTKRVICFCMGGLGVPSRLFSPLLGGYMTYASVERGEEAAPGQLTIRETKGFYEMMRNCLQ